jgi:cbb3-type cytochrome oxidase subunit 1
MPPHDGAKSIRDITMPRLCAQGPMMAIKTVNALSHYTDWTIGHVHSGALGWVAMISIGALYHMIPRLWGRESMHSISLINVHFWMATIGTVLTQCTGMHMADGPICIVRECVNGLDRHHRAFKRGHSIEGQGNDKET